MKPKVAIGAVVTLVAGCSLFSGVGDIWEVHGSPESSELQLVVDSCNADLSAEVDEQSDEVAIRVTVENDTTDDCLDSLTVQLSSPLGDRTVVDAFDGDAPVVQSTDS